MAGHQSNWDFAEPDAWTSSGAPNDDLPDDWAALELDSFEDDVRDAFEVDDSVEDPEPEYGDFWPERDAKDEI